MALDRECVLPLPSQIAVTAEPRLAKRLDELAHAFHVHCLPRQLHEPPRVLQSPAADHTDWAWFAKPTTSPITTSAGVGRSRESEAIVPSVPIRSS
jgi:hypothetical protein